jgi:hypothetical protein
MQGAAVLERVLGDVAGGQGFLRCSVWALPSKLVWRTTFDGMHILCVTLLKPGEMHACAESNCAGKMPKMPRCICCLILPFGSSPAQPTGTAHLCVLLPQHHLVAVVRMIAASNAVVAMTIQALQQIRSPRHLEAELCSCHPYLCLSPHCCCLVLWLDASRTPRAHCAAAATATKHCSAGHGQRRGRAGVTTAGQLATASEASGCAEQRSRHCTLSEA